MKMLSRFRRDGSSTAALEFALLAPLMLILFLGVIELTCVLRLQQKLNLAAGQLADLVAGQPAVTEGTAEGPGGTLGDMCTGASYDLLPFNPAGLSAWIESTTVINGFNGPQLAQDWANDRSCPSAILAGSNYETLLLSIIALTPLSMFTQNGLDNGALVPGYSSISLRLSYTYTNIVPFLLGHTLTLTAVAVARPRTNTTIPCTYVAANGTAQSCPAIY